MGNSASLDSSVENMLPLGLGHSPVDVEFVAKDIQQLHKIISDRLEFFEQLSPGASCEFLNRSREYLRFASNSLISLSLPLSAVCDFYYFLSQIPPNIFHSKALLQQLRGAVSRRIQDVIPAHSFSEFTVSKVHATDLKLKRMILLPMALQTEDKESGKYFKEHMFSTVSSLQVDEHDARSIRLVIPSAADPKTTQELVLQAQTLDERWLIYHVIADLRASYRQQIESSVRWAKFERASKHTDFTVLNGIAFQKSLPCFDSLIATLTSRLEREALNLSTIERANIQLQRASLFYRQGDYRLCIHDINTAFVLGGGARAFKAIVLAAALELRALCHLKLASYVLEHEIRPAVHAQVAADLGWALAMGDQPNAAEAAESAVFADHEGRLREARADNVPLLAKNDAMDLCRHYAELALADLNIRRQMHADCFGGALPSLHAHETRPASHSVAGTVGKDQTDPQPEVMPRDDISFTDDDVDRLVSLLACVSPADYSATTAPSVLAGDLVPSVLRHLMSHASICALRARKDHGSIKNLSPAVLATLPSKHELHLSCQRFKELKPSQLTELLQLEYLDLNENYIRDLDCSWFDSLPNLRTLMLENNEMESIKGKFMLTNLEHLWLGNNELEDRDAVLSACYSFRLKLKTLKLAGNPFVKTIANLMGASDENIYSQADLQKLCELYRFPIVLEFPSLQELDLCPVTLAERHEALMSQNSGPLIDIMLKSASPDPLIQHRCALSLSIMACSPNQHAALTRFSGIRHLLKFTLFGREPAVRSDALSALSHLLLYSPFALQNELSFSSAIQAGVEARSASNTNKFALNERRRASVVSSAASEPLDESDADTSATATRRALFVDNPLAAFRNLGGLPALGMCLWREHVAFCSDNSANNGSSSSDALDCVSFPAEFATRGSSRSLVHRVLSLLWALLLPLEAVPAQPVDVVDESRQQRSAFEAAEDALLQLPLSLVYRTRTQHALETLRNGLEVEGVSLVRLLLDILRVEASSSIAQSSDRITSPSTQRIALSLLSILLLHRAAPFKNSCESDRNSFIENSGPILLSRLLASQCQLSNIDASTVDVNSLQRHWSPFMIHQISCIILQLSPLTRRKDARLSLLPVAQLQEAGEQDVASMKAGSNLSPFVTKSILTIVLHYAQLCFQAMSTSVNEVAALHARSALTLSLSTLIALLNDSPDAADVCVSIAVNNTPALKQIVDMVVHEPFSMIAIRLIERMCTRVLARHELGSSAHLKWEHCLAAFALPFPEPALIRVNPTRFVINVPHSHNLLGCNAAFAAWWRLTLTKSDGAAKLQSLPLSQVMSVLRRLVYFCRLCVMLPTVIPTDQLLIVEAAESALIALGALMNHDIAESTFFSTHLLPFSHFLVSAAQNLFKFCSKLESSYSVAASATASGIVCSSTSCVASVVNFLDSLLRSLTAVRSFEPLSLRHKLREICATTIEAELPEPEANMTPNKVAKLIFSSAFVSEIAAYLQSATSNTRTSERTMSVSTSNFIELATLPGCARLNDAIRVIISLVSFQPTHNVKRLLTSTAGSVAGSHAMLNWLLSIIRSSALANPEVRSTALRLLHFCCLSSPTSLNRIDPQPSQLVSTVFQVLQTLVTQVKTLESCHPDAGAEDRVRAKHQAEISLCREQIELIQMVVIQLCVPSAPQALGHDSDSDSSIEQSDPSVQIRYQDSIHGVKDSIQLLCECFAYAAAQTHIVSADSTPISIPLAAHAIMATCCGPHDGNLKSISTCLVEDEFALDYWLSAAASVCQAAAVERGDEFSISNFLIDEVDEEQEDISKSLKAVVDASPLISSMLLVLTHTFEVKVSRHGLGRISSTVLHAVLKSMHLSKLARSPALRALIGCVCNDQSESAIASLLPHSTLILETLIELMSDQLEWHEYADAAILMSAIMLRTHNVQSKTLSDIEARRNCVDVALTALANVAVHADSDKALRMQSTAGLSWESFVAQFCSAEKQQRSRTEVARTDTDDEWIPQPPRSSLLPVVSSQTSQLDQTVAARILLTRAALVIMEHSLAVNTASTVSSIASRGRSCIDSVSKLIGSSDELYLQILISGQDALRMGALWPSSLSLNVLLNDRHQSATLNHTASWILSVLHIARLMSIFSTDARLNKLVLENTQILSVLVSWFTVSQTFFGLSSLEHVCHSHNGQANAIIESAHKFESSVQWLPSSLLRLWQHAHLLSSTALQRCAMHSDLSRAAVVDCSLTNGQSSIIVVALAFMMRIRSAPHTLSAETQTRNRHTALSLLHLIAQLASDSSTRVKLVAAGCVDELIAMIQFTSSANVSLSLRAMSLKAIARVLQDLPDPHGVLSSAGGIEPLVRALHTDDSSDSEQLPENLECAVAAAAVLEELIWAEERNHSSTAVLRLIQGNLITQLLPYVPTGESLWDSYHQQAPIRTQESDSAQPLRRPSSLRRKLSSSVVAIPDKPDEHVAAAAVVSKGPKRNAFEWVYAQNVGSAEVIVYEEIDHDAFQHDDMHSDAVLLAWMQRDLTHHRTSSTADSKHHHNSALSVLHTLVPEPITRLLGHLLDRHIGFRAFLEQLSKSIQAAEHANGSDENAQQRVSRALVALWFFIDSRSAHSSGSSTWSLFMQHSRDTSLPSTKASLAASLLQFANQAEVASSGTNMLPAVHDGPVDLVDSAVQLLLRTLAVSSSSLGLGGGTIWTPSARHCALTAVLTACDHSSGVINSMVEADAPNCLLDSLELSLQIAVVDRSRFGDTQAHAICALVSMYIATLDVLLRGSVKAARVVLQRFPVSHLLHSAHAYFLNSHRTNYDRYLDSALSMCVFLVQRRHVTSISDDDQQCSSDLSAADLELLLHMPRSTAASVTSHSLVSCASHSWTLVLHFANMMAAHRFTLRHELDINEITALMLLTSRPGLQRIGHQLLTLLYLHPADNEHDEHEDADVVDALLMNHCESVSATMCSLLRQHSLLVRRGQVSLLHIACQLISRITVAAERTDRSREIGAALVVNGVTMQLLSLAAALNASIHTDDKSTSARPLTFNGRSLNDAHSAPLLIESSSESDNDEVDTASTDVAKPTSDKLRRQLRSLVLASLDSAQHVVSLAEDLESEHFVALPIEFLLSSIAGGDLNVSEPVMVLLLQLCTHVRCDDGGVIDRLARAGLVPRIAHLLEVWVPADRALRAASLRTDSSKDISDTFAVSASAVLTRHILLGLHILSSVFESTPRLLEDSDSAVSTLEIVPIAALLELLSHPTEALVWEAMRLLHTLASHANALKFLHSLSAKCMPALFTTFNHESFDLIRLGLAVTAKFISGDVDTPASLSAPPAPAVLAAPPASTLTPAAVELASSLSPTSATGSIRRKAKKVESITSPSTTVVPVVNQSAVRSAAMVSASIKWCRAYLMEHSESLLQLCSRAVVSDISVVGDAAAILSLLTKSNLVFGTRLMKSPLFDSLLASIVSDNQSADPTSTESVHVLPVLTILHNLMAAMHASTESDPAVSADSLSQWRSRNVTRVLCRLAAATTATSERFQRERITTDSEHLLLLHTAVLATLQLYASLPSPFVRQVTSADALLPVAELRELGALPIVLGAFPAAAVVIECAQVLPALQPLSQGALHRPVNQPVIVSDDESDSSDDDSESDSELGSEIGDEHAHTAARLSLVPRLAGLPQAPSVSSGSAATSPHKPYVPLSGRGTNSGSLALYSARHAPHPAQLNSARRSSSNTSVLIGSSGGGGILLSARVAGTLHSQELRRAHKETAMSAVPQLFGVLHSQAPTQTLMASTPAFAAFLSSPAGSAYAATNTVAVAQAAPVASVSATAAPVLMPVNNTPRLVSINAVPSAGAPAGPIGPVMTPVTGSPGIRVVAPAPATPLQPVISTAGTESPQFVSPRPAPVVIRLASTATPSTASSVALPPLPPTAPALAPPMPVVSFAVGALVLTWLDLVSVLCAADTVCVSVLRASPAWITAIAQSLLLGAKGQSMRAKACSLLNILVGEHPTPELQFLELQPILLHALCTYARLFGTLDVDTAPIALSIAARLLPLPGNQQRWLDIKGIAHMLPLLQHTALPRLMLEALHCVAAAVREHAPSQQYFMSLLQGAKSTASSSAVVTILARKDADAVRASLQVIRNSCSSPAAIQHWLKHGVLPLFLTLLDWQLSEVEIPSQPVLPTQSLPASLVDVIKVVPAPATMSSAAQAVLELVLQCIHVMLAHKANGIPVFDSMLPIDSWMSRLRSVLLTRSPALQLICGPILSSLAQHAQWAQDRQQQAHDAALAELALNDASSSPNQEPNEIERKVSAQFADSELMSVFRGLIAVAAVSDGDDDTTMDRRFVAVNEAILDALIQLFAANRENIRLFLSRAGVDVVARLLRSRFEELQFRATQIFTLFTQDADMVRRMSKQEVVPVFAAMFGENALPPRMRAFAVQTLGNLLALDDSVAAMLEKIDGLLPQLIAGLKDKSHSTQPSHCLQVLALLCRASPMAREQIRALETLRIVISEFLIAGSNHLTFEPRPSDELFVQDYNLEDQDGKMFQVMDDESRTDADESVEQRNADSASSELSASMQVVCMAAYSLTYLASSNEDQEVFRALQGIPLLLRMLMKVETQRIPFLVMYNFAWALGVVIDQNPVGQAEVCNIPGSLNFVLNLCRHTHVKIRRKAMLILTGLCQDSSARVYVRENKGIDYILECLHHEDFQLHSNALNAAAAICEDPLSREIMFQNKFLPAVLEMLHESDNELCAAVAKVLHAIIDGHADNALAALDLGIVSQVCTTLLRRVNHHKINDHLSALLMVLRRYHVDRFDADLQACRGNRALLQLIRTDQIHVAARIAPMIRDLTRIAGLGSVAASAAVAAAAPQPDVAAAPAPASSAATEVDRDAGVKDLLDADAVSSITHSLRWIVDDSVNAATTNAETQAQAVSARLAVVRDGCHALLSLLHARRDLVTYDLKRAKGIYVYACAILAHAQLHHELGPVVLELLHTCSLPRVSALDDPASPVLATAAPPELQTAMFEQQALFPLLELTHHSNEQVKRACFQVLVAVCHECDRNKQVLRDRQALSMLATFLSSPHLPSDLRRLVVRAALEIGFACDSTPFWTHIGDILRVRDSESDSEKHRAEAERLVEQERARRELETHELRKATSAAEEKAQAALQQVKVRDEELKKEREAHAEIKARCDATGRQLAIVNAQHKELAVSADKQQELLRSHIASLQDLLAKAQEEIKVVRAKQEELVGEQATVNELHEYMVAVAKFCNVKPPSKGRRGSVMPGQ